jgi:hypothetical protein
MKRSVVFLLAVAAAGTAATAAPARHSTARSGELHVTKECSQYNGTVGSFCTIKSSNIDAIKPDMRVVYLAAPANGVLDADIVLSFGQGSAAFGHVVLNLTTAKGRVTFTGGTGAFAGFHAGALVSVDAKGIWHWDGVYRFSP